jgi:L-asparaginase/Glu-tRNA(Gln) amidotransferase subunit D
MEDVVNATLNTRTINYTLVYVDATRGWKNTMDSTSNVTGPNYITATGGTITCCGDYKIHTFTSDGTFTICSALPTSS